MQELLNELLGGPPMEWAKDQIQSNDMLIGLIGLTIVGSLLYYLRNIPVSIWNGLKKLFVVELKAYDEFGLDYKRFLYWLIKNNITTKRTRSLTLNKEISHLMGEEDNTNFFTLDSGNYIFYHNKRLFLVNHHIGDMTSGGRREKTITMKTIALSNACFNNIIKEVNKLDELEKENMIETYLYKTGDFSPQGFSEKRKIETVILPETQKQNLINDIDWFFRSKEWYKMRGIPYRRGYLLEGPPGTGKTSTVFAIASYFSRPIYILNLSSVGSDSQLIEAFSEVRRGSILLLEDIDVMGANVSSRSEKILENGDSNKDFEEDDDVENDGANQGSLLTMSGMLNALDGILSPEEIIVFMTTNNPDKLDPALKRSGRIDRKEHIGYPGFEEVKKLFFRFYPDKSEEEAEKFANFFMNQNAYVSQSDIQEICIEYAFDPNGAIEKLKEEQQQ